MRAKLLVLPILMILCAGAFTGTGASAWAGGQQASPNLHQGQNQPTFAVGVNLIKIPISVFDEHGAPVLDLDPADFRVYEDGIPQKIRSLGIDRNPVSVVLVLDASATVEQESKKIRQAARDFVTALSKEDRFSVISFSDSAVLVLDWTDNGKKVQKALRNLEPGIRTALYDAMFMAAQDQLLGIEGRKAIILLTDALNNQSRVTFRQASQAIIQSQAPLYVVSKTLIVRQAAKTQRRVLWLNNIYRRLTGDGNYVDEFFEQKEREMSELAEKTGGRCLFPPNFNEIGAAYGEIAEELKNQYYLTYVTNQVMVPASYHSIKVEYLRPAAKLVYRQGYYYRPKPVPRPRY
jgi:Ca-activated chloride channel family protein